MTYKAYIVANKQQEIEALNNLEEKGFKWGSEELPTEFIFSDSFWFNGFPYAIKEYNDICKIGWTYDIRKEGKMYKVTQEFINELIKWRDEMNLDTNAGKDTFVDGYDIQNMNDVVNNWWADNVDPIECNNRLIAIVQWLNGEDVFEVEEPHKFVVRSDKYNFIGEYTYVAIRNYMTTTTRILSSATKFDAREEAQEWANSHQVVVEIDEDGNEVE